MIKSNIIILFTFFLWVTPPVWAEDTSPVDLTQPVAELRLRDGKVLKNVKFVSFATSAAMARWEGGMGAIAYNTLPDSILGAVLEKATPARKASDARKNAAQPPARKTVGVEILRQSQKVIENDEGYVTWSWSADVRNHDGLAHETMARVRLLDSQGHVVIETYSDVERVGPRSQRTISGQGFDREEIYRKVKTFEIYIKSQ